MKLWAGRFKDDTHALLETFNASIDFDKVLYKEDIEGSIAHAKMLFKMGILSEDELERVILGLKDVKSAIENETVNLCVKNEDIHMNVEALLVDSIGPLGKKIHTARSRNDQVAFDTKQHTKSAAKEVCSNLEALLETLLVLSEGHMAYIMPGYTHLQAAQPIRLSFHLMAYFEMFKRDHKRFKSLIASMNELPLGSGALSGISYASDRHYLASLLGYNAITENAMDAVSDRDFIIEFQSYAAIAMMHLSRFCEEIVLWSSQAFAFVNISDAFSTGSSIMPQKKNPDAAELIRGKTGRIYGNLMGILTVMKSLPLAYNKDMQEDKEGLFDTIKTVNQSLAVFTAMLKELSFNGEKMAQSAKVGFINATDLADYLVKKGLAFRDCHEIVGQIILYCVENHTVLEALPLETYKSFCPFFSEDVYQAIDLNTAIEAKHSYGSTKESAIKAHMTHARQYLVANALSASPSTL